MKKRFSLLIPSLILFSCAINDRPVDKKKLASYTPASLDDMKKSFESYEIEKACGTACIFSDFEGRFLKSDGLSLSSPSYAETLSKKLTRPEGKIMSLLEKSEGFSLEASKIYGHIDSIDEVAFSEECSISSPLKDGAEISRISSSQGSLGSGEEDLGPETLPDLFISNIRAEGMSKKGVIKAGEGLKVSFELSEAEGTRLIKYEDFDSAEGLYALEHNLRDQKDSENTEISGTLRALSSGPCSVKPTPNYCTEAMTIQEAKASARIALKNIPGAYEYGEVKSVAEANALYAAPALGYLGNSNMPSPVQDACNDQKKPYVMSCLVDAEASMGSAVKQFSCEWTAIKPIDLKPGWKKFPSPRLASGGASVSCWDFPDMKLLGDRAELKGDWRASIQAQYFVSDARFNVSCTGLDCGEKLIRLTERDAQKSDVEPASNRCIERWMGWDFQSYIKAIEDQCTAQQVYIDAKKIEDGKLLDKAFGEACEKDEICREAVSGMLELSKTGADTYESLISKEELKFKEAKALKASYLSEVPELSSFELEKKLDAIEKISLGLDKAKALHDSIGSSWLGGAFWVTREESGLPGFSSYAEAKASVPVYQKILEKAYALTALDLQSLGCTYKARGRVRKYGDFISPEFRLKPREEKSFDAAAKVDISL